MKEYTDTKMTVVLTTIDSSRFYSCCLAKGSSSTRIPHPSLRNIKLACALLVKIILMIITIPDTLLMKRMEKSSQKGFPLNRIISYAQTSEFVQRFRELKDYAYGIQQTSGFFNTPNGKFIWQDYLYQDRLLNATAAIWNHL